MTYPDAIRFLSGIQVFGQQLGLETMLALLDRLGNPHRHLRFLHIAGTNGKGSVAAMTQSVLTAAGYHAGLYTSPHLVSFCERIQIDGQLIPETEVAALVTELQPHLVATPRHPTLFEVVTAMALLHFQRNHADIIVWETGLGGRLDATNVVIPLVSVITNIGLDHTQYLGDTLPKIAAEKAGIIKPGIPVVTAAEGDALDVIRDTCRQRRSALTVVGEDVCVERLGEDLEHGQTVRLHGTRQDYGTLNVPLLGAHQAVNCATAVAALEASGLPVSDAMQRGIAATRWPGRFQVVRRDPLLILDGAHNAHGAERLAALARTHLGGRKLTLVLGVLRDKDYERVCGLLAPLATRILCVPVSNERTCAPEEIARCCRAANPDTAVRVCQSVGEALDATRHEETTLVAGSLFLIGEATALLTNAGREAERCLQ